MKAFKGNCATLPINLTLLFIVMATYTAQDNTVKIFSKLNVQFQYKSGKQISQLEILFTASTRVVCNFTNLKYLSDTTMRLRGPLLIAAWHGFFCLIRSRILLKRTLNKTVPRTFYRLCVNRFGDVTKIVIFSDYII